VKWDLYAGALSPTGRYRHFLTPILDVTKRMLWQDAPARHRKLLEQTWSCESHTAQDGIDCITSRAKAPCGPCMARLKLEALNETA